MPGVTVRALRHVVGVLTGSHRKTIAAFGLVTDDDGRVLMVRTTYRGRVWHLPGGRTERNERPHETVVREVREETGLDVRVERLTLVDGYRTGAMALIFRCSVAGGELRAQPGEISAVHWMTDAELDRMEPWRRRLIRLARDGADARYIS